MSEPAAQQPAEQQPPAALARIPVPEVVVFETIKNDIGPAIDNALKHAAKLAVNIVDDATRDLAVDAVEKLKDDALTPLKRWREEFYMQVWYRPGETVREVFDSRIKPAETAIKTMLGKVSDYNLKKEREEKIAKEKAEAEARRLREEAERKQREAEEAERRRKDAEAAEKKRIEEAAAAEARRIQAEKEAKERLERDAREAAAAETARKLKEEQDARLAHAQEAEAQGNGAAKVETILESATPISPVLAKPEQTKDLETLRLEQEQATRITTERLLRERAESEAAEKRRIEAEAEAQRTRAEAEQAVAAATAAAAAAATTSIAKHEEARTFGVERWVWDLDSDGTVDGDRKAFIAMLEGVIAAIKGQVPIPPGFDPLKFVGFDEDHPEKFRPSAISEAVTESKDKFRWPGIRAYPQRDERLKPRRTVGGRR